jgi:hypothetical protein
MSESKANESDPKAAYLYLDGSVRGAAHTVYYDDDVLVVEIYAYGDTTRYEYANLIKFNPVQQDALALSLGVPPVVDQRYMLELLRRRFLTYQAVKIYVVENKLEFIREVDFLP